MGAAKLISFLTFGGFQLIALLAGAGFAVVAACRYKLASLWLLAGGAVLLALNGSGHLLMACPVQIVEHDTLMRYFNVVGWFYYASLFTTLAGWCILALRGKGHLANAEPGASPNGGPATRFGNSGATEGPPSVS
jgi:hypothetical protein